MSHDARGTLTTALAGLALATLPFLASAQGTPTPQQPRTGTASQQKSAPAPGSAQAHLDQAKRALDSINASSLKGDARTQFTELRQHFAQLESAWRAKAATGAHASVAPSSHEGGHTATTGGMTSGTAAGTTAGTSGTPEQVGATGPTGRQARTGTMGNPPGNDAIMTHYNAIAALLDRLSPSATTVADASADATTRQKLAEFRRHLDQFHAAAMSQSGGAAASASSSFPSATTEAAGAVAAGTASPTPTAAQAAPPPATPGINDAAIARLTSQIDDLLSAGKPAHDTVGTSGAAAAAGTVCVDRAKLEQLRIDLQGLRGQPR